MKTNPTRFSVIVAAGLIGTIFTGCGPAHVIGDAEIPAVKELGPVMWALAEQADPAFKKIEAPTYLDADWAAFTKLSGRLQIASAKIRQDFSKGGGWNAFADALGVQAGELLQAANARDSRAASGALTATRAACRGCHQEFR